MGTQVHGKGDVKTYTHKMFERWEGGREKIDGRTRLWWWETNWQLVYINIRIVKAIESNVDLFFLFFIYGCNPIRN